MADRKNLEDRDPMVDDDVVGRGEAGEEDIDEADEFDDEDLEQDEDELEE